MTNGEIQKGHTLANLDNTLGSNTSHRRSKSSIELEYGELVEEGRVLALGEVAVGNNLLWCGRLNLGPVAGESYVSSRYAYTSGVTHIFCPLAASLR